MQVVQCNQRSISLVLGEKIMFNKKQFSIIIFLSIISLIFAGISLAANWSFSYKQAPSNFICSATRVFSTDGTVSYNLPKNAKVMSREYLNGSHYMTINSKLSGKGSTNYPVLSSQFTSAQSFPYVYTINYTVTVASKVVSESSISVKCIDANTALVVASSLTFSGDAEGVVVSPPDDRFNWQTGDSHIAIVYPEGENIGLYLYDGELYIPNFVTVDDIAEYVDNAPAENTLIASAGGVSVYVLTTGEISFIIGPDAEGKQYALIMSDLSGSDAYGYEL